MADDSSASVSAYLVGLPPDRREAVEAVRSVILEHLPEGYHEEMAFGMIGYVVLLERYPDTYNGQPLLLAALASQKRHLSLYLHGLYADEAGLERFLEAYRASGKRLDMGKSCVRFRTVDDLPLDAVGDAIAALPVDAYIEQYEAARQR